MTIHNIKRFTDYLCKFDKKVNANCFYVLFLIWKQDIESWNKYLKRKGELPILLEEFDYLLELEYINPKVKDNRTTIKLEDYEVTDKFLKLVTVDENDAYLELLKYFPKRGKIEKSNIDFNAHNLHKDIGSSMYHKAINGESIEHFKIVEIVKEFYKHKEFADVAIEKFIQVRHWEYLETLMKTKGKDKVNRA